LINNSYLQSLTETEREELRAKAAQSRLYKKVASANIQSMTDENYWRDLCSTLCVRMPQSVCQSSELKYIKRIANKLNVDINVWIKDVCGCKSLKEVAELNPNIGAVGMVGFFIEHCKEVLDGKFIETPKEKNDKHIQFLALIYASNARVVGMNAANQQRAVQGDSIAYTEDHFQGEDNQLEYLAEEAIKQND